MTVLPLVRMTKALGSYIDDRPSLDHHSPSGGTRQLVSCREAHDRARAEFVWPDPGDSLYGAIDWFDVASDEDEHAALVTCGPGGTHASWSFKRMRHRLGSGGGGDFYGGDQQERLRNCDGQ